MTGPPNGNGGADGGLSALDGGASACLAGGVCAPGQGCGSRDSSGNSLCCTCGADGHFQCGGTCAGQSTPDGGHVSGGGNLCMPGAACVVGSGRCGDASPTGQCLMCDCGADGTYVCSPCDGGVTNPPGPDGGAPPNAMCVDGAACPPGTGCKGPSSLTGQCLACTCAAGGTLQCVPCGGGAGDASAPPPGDDGGSTAPPATCDPGLACPPGYRCGNKTPQGACSMCSCGADGHLACGACPGTPDAGAPPPPSDASAPPNIPPQACMQGGACPQVGVGCNNGLPSGNGCMKCACGQNLQLMCGSC
jgi:hypothetical protein